MISQINTSHKIIGWKFKEVSTDTRAHEFLSKIRNFGRALTLRKRVPNPGEFGFLIVRYSDKTRRTLGTWNVDGVVYVETDDYIAGIPSNKLAGLVRRIEDNEDSLRKRFGNKITYCYRDFIEKNRDKLEFEGGVSQHRLMEVDENSIEGMVQREIHLKQNLAILKMNDQASLVEVKDPSHPRIRATYLIYPETKGIEDIVSSKYSGVRSMPCPSTKYPKGFIVREKVGTSFKTLFFESPQVFVKKKDYQPIKLDESP